jgi:hypothetical protein
MAILVSPITQNSSLLPPLFNPQLLMQKLPQRVRRSFKGGKRKKLHTAEANKANPKYPQPTY